MLQLIIMEFLLRILLLQNSLYYVHGAMNQMLLLFHTTMQVVIYAFVLSMQTDLFHIKMLELARLLMCIKNFRFYSAVRYVKQNYDYGRVKLRSKQTQYMKTVKFVFFFLEYRIELQCQPYHPHKKYLYNPFHLHLLQ